MENQLIKIENLQIGDEVIVRGIDLNYLKVIRVPKQTQGLNHHKQSYTYWKKAKCKRMNIEKLEAKWDEDKEVYFDFDYKAIWLVKREKF